LDRSIDLIAVTASFITLLMERVIETVMNGGDKVAFAHVRELRSSLEVILRQFSPTKSVSALNGKK
jgi:hypothetical protein